MSPRHPRLKKFVVKLQLSLASSGPQSILVYNEDHSITYQQEATPQLVALFGKKPKIYMLAYLTPDNQMGLLHPAEEQDW
jgi:hypothetical protein